MTRRSLQLCLATLFVASPSICLAQDAPADTSAAPSTDRLSLRRYAMGGAIVLPLDSSAILMVDTTAGVSIVWRLQASKLQCPMPVSVPPPEATVPMPTVNPGSGGAVPMPTAPAGCVNPLFRKR
jgi:hypothetical protein